MSNLKLIKAACLVFPNGYVYWTVADQKVIEKTANAWKEAHKDYMDCGVSMSVSSITMGKDVLSHEKAM